MKRLDDCLTQVVKKFVPRYICGAVWGVFYADECWYGACGTTSRDSQLPMNRKTWFDLASLTKVIGTLPVILMATKRKLLSLDDTLSKFIPHLSGEIGSVTPRQLLSHTAGLPADFGPIEREDFLDANQLWDRISHLSPVRSSSPIAIYSDVGYFLLGILIETIAKDSFGHIVQHEISEPLGIPLLEHVDPFQESVAATRYCPVRQRIVRGEPQNLVSWIWKRACGHAGLFGTVDSVLNYGRWWLTRLNDPLFAETIHPVVPGRGLGWMLAGCDQLPLVEWPVDTFGHTGFTGTSLIIMPKKRIVGVLLTNRTHPFPNNPWIRQLRIAFYQTLLDYP